MNKIDYENKILEKYTQMYLFILSIYYKGISIAKLATLLYLIDFSHFYKSLNTMSGVLYRHKEDGPRSDLFIQITNSLLKEGTITNSISNDNVFLLKENIDLNLLSKQEKKEIRNLCSLWKDIDTNTMIAFSKSQKPWMASRNDEIIPYSLIIQEDPNHVYLIHKNI